MNQQPRMAQPAVGQMYQPQQPYQQQQPQSYQPQQQQQQYTQRTQLPAQVQTNLINTYVPHTHQYGVPNQLDGVFTHKNTTTNSNLVNIQTVQPPQYVLSSRAELIQPIQQEKVAAVHEVHHYERPLQVVTIDDMESKWKNKCFHLEYQVYELQVEIQRLRNQTVTYEPQVVRDDGRIQELEQQNRRLKDSELALQRERADLLDQIQEWQNRYKKLEDLYTKGSSNEEQMRQLKKKIADLESDLRDANDKLQLANNDLQNMSLALRDKDDMINQLQSEIENMDAKLESYTQVESTVSQLREDVELWKSKFREKNGQFQDSQEKAFMLQAQLEALQNRKTVVQKEQTVTTSQANNVRSSTSRPSNVYDKKQL